MRCIAAGKEELEAGSCWRKIQKQELADKLALGAEPGEPAALGGPAPWHEGCVSHGPHIVHGWRKLALGLPWVLANRVS